MRKIFAILIACTPFNALRIFLYRTILKYDISYKSKVKPFNLLLCNSIKMAERSGIIGFGNIFSKVNIVELKYGAKIGKLNRFRSFNTLILGKEATVKVQNIFSGTFFDFSPFKEHENIIVGDKSIITSKHIFDLSDEIIIGEDVTFGGSGSQIWTHGFDLEHTKVQAGIKIGNCCYIGSMAMIMPGVNVCDNVSIAGGTVVSKSIDEPGFYVSAHLQKKSELTLYKNSGSAIERNGFHFYRKENNVK